MKYIAIGDDYTKETFDCPSLADAVKRTEEWLFSGEYDTSEGSVTVDAVLYKAGPDGEPDDNDYGEPVEVTILSEEDDEHEDGSVLAENEGEYSTERIVSDGSTLYYVHANGGSRGSWDRQCGDGVWRDHPVEPTLVIDDTEATRLMLDWGYDMKHIKAVL